MKRITALLAVLCLLISLCPSVFTAEQKQYDYSGNANSGVRHEVCTTLLGTSASEYYTGSYTYDKLSKLCGDDLLEALRELMSDTHTNKSDYDDCHYLANLTDCENEDQTSINLIFTSYSANQEGWCNNTSGGWNREHVWPKSLGGFGTTGAGADLHHIRPVDQNVNGNCHNNRKYGYAPDGKTAKGTSYTGGAVGGTYSTYFEPLDDAKGDIARICLYVYARYGGEISKCSDLTNVFESVDVLLEWCALDPVDTWEMGRNEVVGAYQGNRNVFIDYPELAWLLFDKDIPTDMDTPSGEAANYKPAACVHNNTTLKNAKNPTCTKDGYTGDTYCTECNEKVKSGKSISATGHSNKNGDNTCDVCGKSVACGHGKTELKYEMEANCAGGGYTGDTYCVYCDKLIEEGKATPATGDHTYGDWTIVKNPTFSAPGKKDHTCIKCGYTETAEIPQLDEPVTEPTEPETVPTEPETVPTEPETVPTEPETVPTEPETVPSEPTTAPSETIAPTTQPSPQNTNAPSTNPTEQTVQEETPFSSTWPVIAILAVGAWLIIMVVVLKTKKS